MKGFVAYHTTHGRHKFIDQIYVQPRMRCKYIGSSLLHAIATGPLELIVHQSNYKAIAFYARHGFCKHEHCTYTCRRYEYCMKTANFKRTKQTLRATHSPSHVKWDNISSAVKTQMIRGIQSEHNLTEAAAKRILMGGSAKNARTIMQYMIL